MRHAAWAVFALVACLGEGAARADQADSDRAEQLFEEGKVLRGSGQDAAACRDFEASRRLDEGIGVTLYLADCYQHLGETARARIEFRRAQALAQKRNDARWVIAKKRADALDPLGPAAPVAAPQGPAAPSVPATADAPPAVHAAEPPADARATDLPQSMPPRRSAGQAQRWIGGLIAGAGVVGLGIGTAFGALAMAKLAQSNSGPCGADDRCSEAGLSLRQDASQAATVSTIGFAAGAAALAGGVALYVSAPRHGERVALAPALWPTGGGASVVGRF